MISEITKTIKRNTGHYYGGKPLIVSLLPGKITLKPLGDPKSSEVTIDCGELYSSKRVEATPVEAPPAPMDSSFENILKRIQELVHTQPANGVEFKEHYAAMALLSNTIARLRSLKNDGVESP